MAHAADFADAHRRHWVDAELLFGRDRWANADQLYGFSAECGLKAVMRSFGMPVDVHGKPTADEHRKHVQEIWQEFRDFVAGRSGTRYLKWLPAGEPFSGWSHHDRYAHERHFDRAATEPHRDAAREIQDMVQNLNVDHGR